MGKKRAAHTGDYVFEDLPSEWDIDKLTNILKAAHVPCTSITRPVPHASWALVSLRDYRDSHLAAAAFERAAMAEEAHPGAAEAHPGAEGGIPTRGAEEASDEGSSQAGEDGGVKQEGSAQKKKARGGKKKRFRHRESTFLRTPKIPAADLNIADVVCPLRDVPYSQQLLVKQEKVIDALTMLTKKVRGQWLSDSSHGTPPPWVTTAAAAPTPLACPLLGIVRSPQVDGYRNKCEFSIALGVDGLPTVGFLLGAYRDGYIEVAPPLECRHIPPTTITVASWTQDYIRESTLPVWDKRCNAGFWRLLIVREGRHSTWLPTPPGAPSPPAPLAFSTLSWGPWWVDTSAAPRPHDGYMKGGNVKGGTGDTEGGALGSTQNNGDAAAGAAAGGAGAARNTAVTAGVVQPGGTLAWASMSDIQEPAAPPCDELLVMIQVNPTAAPSPEAAAAECAALGQYLLQRAAEHSNTANQQHPNSPQFPKITALLVQEHAGISNAAQPDAPVMDMLTGHVLAAGVGGDGVGEDGVGGDGVGGDGAQQGAAQQQQVAQEKQLVQGEQQQIQVEQEDCTPPRAAYVNDALCDLSFRVSSGAFFQVNNGAAAVLYALAGDWISADGRALLLDVCCGTGTIGLSLAHRVREVVGVEMVEQAIIDARVNAADNNITNCTFVCGKAEDVLPGMLSGGISTQFDDHTELVAIVDPPRAGLHPKVLKALLRCERLQRIVYVSCNPESMAANCAVLCGPAPSGPRDNWKPFVPVKAMAVDLFPHTKHCEAVMLLER